MKIHIRNRLFDLLEMPGLQIRKMSQVAMEFKKKLSTAYAQCMITGVTSKNNTWVVIKPQYTDTMQESRHVPHGSLFKWQVTEHLSIVNWPLELLQVVIEKEQSGFINYNNLENNSDNTSLFFCCCFT